MKAQLKILGGAPAGTRFVFSQTQVFLGRHPKCDVHFDPEADLDVSARHAVLFRQGDYWVLRDLGSRNGTFVNGHRIRADTQLSDTDVVRLGQNGPEVEFRAVRENTADTIERTASPAHPATSPRVTASTGHTTARVRVRVAHETRRLRTVVAALGAALLVSLAVAAFVTFRQSSQRQREVTELQNRIDSVLAEHTDVVRGLEGEVQGLVAALQSSRDQIEQLQTAVRAAQASGDADRVRTLRQQLATATAALSAQQNAARIDYPRIRNANQRAVTLVYAEYAGPNGVEVVTGTGFAVRSDAVIVTNRHVIARDDGRVRPRRVAVQFADSDQAYAADIIAISDRPGVDLGALKVRLSGTVHPIQRINASDTIDVGAPVAIIGYPLGTQLPMPRGRTNFIAAPSLTAGIVSRTLPDRLQLQGFGAEGASGSPIFDASGAVIGVLFGGEQQSENRILYAVPGRELREFVDGLP